MERKALGGFPPRATLSKQDKRQRIRSLCRSGRGVWLQPRPYRVRVSGRAPKLRITVLPILTYTYLYFNNE